MVQLLATIIFLCHISSIFGSICFGTSVNHIPSSLHDDFVCPWYRNLIRHVPIPSGLCPSNSTYRKYNNCLADLDCPKDSYCCLSVCHGITRCYNPYTNNWAQNLPNETMPNNPCQLINCSPDEPIVKSQNMTGRGIIAPVVPVPNTTDDLPPEPVGSAEDIYDQLTKTQPSNDHPKAQAEEIGKKILLDGASHSNKTGAGGTGEAKGSTGPILTTAPTVLISESATFENKATSTTFKQGDAEGDISRKELKITVYTTNFEIEQEKKTTLSYVPTSTTIDNASDDVSSELPTTATAEPKRTTVPYLSQQPISETETSLIRSTETYPSESDKVFSSAERSSSTTKYDSTSESELTQRGENSMESKSSVSDRHSTTAVVVVGSSGLLLDDEDESTATEKIPRVSPGDKFSRGSQKSPFHESENIPPGTNGTMLKAIPNNTQPANAGKLESFKKLNESQSTSKTTTSLFQSANERFAELMKSRFGTSSNYDKLALAVARASPMGSMAYANYSDPNMASNNKEDNQGNATAWSYSSKGSNAAFAAASQKSSGSTQKGDVTSTNSVSSSQSALAIFNVTAPNDTIEDSTTSTMETQQNGKSGGSKIKSGSKTPNMKDKERKSIISKSSLASSSSNNSESKFSKQNKNYNFSSTSQSNSFVSSSNIMNSSQSRNQFDENKLASDMRQSNSAIRSESGGKERKSGRDEIQSRSLDSSGMTKESSMSMSKNSRSSASASSFSSSSFSESKNGFENFNNQFFGNAPYFSNSSFGSWNPFQLPTLQPPQIRFPLAQLPTLQQPQIRFPLAQLPQLKSPVLPSPRLRLVRSPSNANKISELPRESPEDFEEKRDASKF